MMHHRFLFLLFGFMLLIHNIHCDEQNSIEENEASGERKKITFKPPTKPSSAFLYLYFTSPSDLTQVLVRSQAKKQDVDISVAKYDGVWSVEVPSTSAIRDDYALVMKSIAKHHAIATKLHKIADFSTIQSFIVQYEVKFQTPLECGGSYIKLLSEQPHLYLEQFTDKTPYTIMFGPDKCGTDSKIHFIFRYQNPVTKEFEEKHMKKPSQLDLSRHFKDSRTHLFTLVINSDDSFEIFIDQTSVHSGSLLTSFEPSIYPPKEIVDPNDLKPNDWDDRAQIPDANAQKPDDWDENQPEFIDDENAQMPTGWLEDEPMLILDPTSVKPKDWDTEMDGEWEAPKMENPKCKESPGCGVWTRPQIKNPQFKGKWIAPLIENPNYKGVWKAKIIPNPNYFEPKSVFATLTPIAALGIELWSMQNEIVFDNFLLTSSKAEADQFARETFSIKQDEERLADPRAHSVVDAVFELTNDRPWAWILIILAIVAPIALLVWLCCYRSNSVEFKPQTQRQQKQQQQQQTAEAKEDEVKKGHSSTTKASLESESSDSDDAGVPPLHADAAVTENKSGSEEEEVEEEEEVATGTRQRPKTAAAAGDNQ